MHFRQATVQHDHDGFFEISLPGLPLYPAPGGGGAPPCSGFPDHQPGIPFAGRSATAPNRSLKTFVTSASRDMTRVMGVKPDHPGLIDLDLMDLQVQPNRLQALRDTGNSGMWDVRKSSLCAQRMAGPCAMPYMQRFPTSQ